MAWAHGCDGTRPFRWLKVRDRASESHWGHRPGLATAEWEGTIVCLHLIGPEKASSKSTLIALMLSETDSC